MKFEVAVYPKAKPEDRKDLYRKYHRMAYPKKRKNKTTREMAQELKSIFGG